MEFASFTRHQLRFVLDGGIAVAEAALGEGKIVLLGPKVNFRDQSHGTYKLLFNSLYYGNAKNAPLQIGAKAGHKNATKTA